MDILGTVLKGVERPCLVRTLSTVSQQDSVGRLVCSALFSIQ